MADRRSSFSFRFWSSGARRSPTNQTAAAPPATTNSVPTTAPRAESQNVRQSTTNTSSPASTPTPPAETQTPGNQVTASPASSSSTTTQTTPSPATTTAPATTTTPGAESQNVNQSATSTTNSTTATPTTDETMTQGSQSTTTTSSPPNPTTPSTKEQQISDQTNTTAPAPTPPPSGNMQTASQPNNTTFTNPTNEPKSSTPSRATTQSPSSSQPKSPSRQITQSRAPPQARSNVSSPSRIGSQSPSTTQRASQPRSPSRLSSRSPKLTSSTSTKGMQPNSPSKEARRTTQQEPQLKADAKTYSAKNFNGETVDGTSPKQDEVKTLPSKSSEVGTTIHPVQASETPMPTQKSDSSNMNGSSAEVTSDSANHSKDQTVDGTGSKRDELNVTSSKSSELGTNTTPVQGLETPTPTQKLESSTVMELTAKPKEAQEVKEVVQETKVEMNEETKKEVDHILTPKSGSGANIIDKGKIPSKLNQKNAEKQEELDTKEILATSVPSVKQTNTTTSLLKKRSMISDTQKKSALPSAEHVALHKDIRDDISTFVNRVTSGDPKTAINDKPVSVITLAGENRGASMQMGSNSSRTGGPVHIHRGYKINPDETAEATTDGEGSSNKGKQSEDAKTTEDQPKEVYVNNNAQGINNSIVFNVSITERNPGVHMVVAHVPKESIQSTDKRSPPETRKAELNMNRMERLTYQPMVRRRCLKGLFLEPSDSDPENPEKPRRHGCRVGCQQRDKKKDVDVL
ncbi:hypothetical protein Salat_1227200 [Sesamum alatum]|uniref:Uncharacterized protein n=1 Tax=Sesamum alatum TaxID=300844 RepID=A0AAE1YFK9_9LAMI|nr:hypothetical protein Salat_1227200 [Sesamum alatum]